MNKTVRKGLCLLKAVFVYLPMALCSYIVFKIVFLFGDDTVIFMHSTIRRLLFSDTTLNYNVSKLFMVAIKSRHQLLFQRAINPVNAKGFVATTESIRTFWKVLMIDANKLAYKGQPAPNVRVLDLKSNKYIDLLDLVKANRPMILNFGNCS